MATISDLAGGITILQTYNNDAPIVATPYHIIIPAIPAASLSGPDVTAITALGWVVHPVHDAYYLPVDTMTEWL